MGFLLVIILWEYNIHNYLIIVSLNKLQRSTHKIQKPIMFTFMKLKLLFKDKQIGSNICVFLPNGNTEASE